MAGALFPALNEINSLSEKYPQAAASAGKPVIGWFCSYTPLEIFHAAGLYPCRIIPEPGRNITRADGFIDRNFCPYVRACLAGALDGEYRFLSGLVVVNSCDAMRRMHDVWRYNIGGDFNYLLDLPRVNSTEAAAYFRENLQKLAAEIETHFKVRITGAALTEAIELLNTSRSMLKELYRLNAAKGQPLAAADVRAVIKASAALPADVINGLLGRLLSEMRDNVARRDESPRILITGSVMDNPMIPRLIEECGAKVVGDDLCNGTRQFWDPVEISPDPMADLSRRYLGRTPCPRMKDAPRRFDHVIRLIDEFKVDAVIFYTMKFCDPFLFDVPPLKERLAARGIPSLLLEGDYTPGTLGRVRTRIEAFIEMLRQNVPAA